MICCGGVGLLLADLGHYSAAPALGGGLILTVVAVALAWTPLSLRRSRDSGTGPAIGALLVAGLTFVWNARYIAHHVWVERDQGVYLSAGKWLTNHNSLVVPAGTVWRGLGGDVTWVSTGMYQSGNSGDLQFQFAHFLSVLLAETDAVGGEG